MAPSTRVISSSNVNEKIVDDGTRRYVNEALAGIRREIKEMLSQITSLSLQNQVVNGAVRPQNQYGRMTKVDFPKNLGEDVKGWIFRCGQFFLIDSIVEDQKRFGTVFDDPMADLQNVKYDSSTKEYQDKFDDLLSRVDISMEHSISLYLAGLPTEIEMGVRMFKPQTLTYAYCLTNLQEDTLNAVKKKSKMQFQASTSRYGGNVTTNTANSKPLLTLPNTTKTWNAKPNIVPPKKQLTQKEYEEKRAKNLEFVDANDKLEDIETEGVQPQISLNSLNEMSSFQTLRVVGLYANKHELHILVDLGSTHNFLDIPMAKILGYSIKKTCPLSVIVARDRQLVSWLSNLGDIKCNFKELKMEFMYNQKKIALRGTHKVVVQMIDERKQLNDMAESTQVEIFMMCVYPNIGLSLMSVEHTSSEVVKEPELSMVVKEFDDVFALPTELPPKRTHEHRIPLMKGVPPVNIRPYRQPLVQKDVIEAMVKELLKAGLNKSTIKDKFPILVIDELIDELHRAVIFSKLDLRSGYHQIIMLEDDIAKTAFKTHEGHYEFLVILFGLTNAPSTFQALMNDVFKAYLRKFTLVFFDDILIYSKSFSEHVQHLTMVLKTMRDHKLFAKKSMKFIKDFASLSRPLTQLLKTNSYKWSDEAQSSFFALKTAMSMAPVLALPDFTIAFEIETDASGMGIEAVLQQRGHFIAYLSNLKYLLDKRITTPAQMKWLPKLMGFDYEVKYKKGVENAVADTLSRVQTEGQLMTAMIVTMPAELSTIIEASWNTDNDLKNKMVVGKDEQLRLDLLTYFHSSSVGGHSVVKVTTHKLCSIFVLESGGQTYKVCTFYGLITPILNCTSGSAFPRHAIYSQTPPIHVPYLGGLSKVDVVDGTLEAREQAIQMLKFHLARSQNRMKQQANKRKE
ncbi:putative mitochondrial protein [Tanacetum coccineum]